MITMDMVGKIRRLHSRGNKSEREIARITGLSRNTIAKWLKGHVAAAPRYRRGPMSVKLTPFAAAIEQALEADAHRPKKDRRTGKALHKEISAAGYAGGYSRLTDFIREWRARRDGAGTAGAFVPLAFEMGEAFQFDWSEEALVIGGIYRKLQVSHMKLCLRATPFAPSRTRHTIRKETNRPTNERSKELQLSTADDQTSASTPGSILGRHGGSELDRRGHPIGVYDQTLDRAPSSHAVGSGAARFRANMTE